MRCKCCDSDNAEFILDDWYCSECSFIIYDVINEDQWLENIDEDTTVPTPKGAK